MAGQEDGLKQIHDAQRGRVDIMNQLALAPLCEVTGVVQPHGAGGSSEDNGLWTLQVSLIAWRVNGGPVRRDTLTLRQQVLKDSLRPAMNCIQDYAIVRASVRLAEHNVMGSPQAMVFQWRSLNSTDPELQAAAEELKRPVQVVHADLGTLTLDRRVMHFDARLPTAGASKGVRVSVRAEGDTPSASGIEAAVRVVRDLPAITAKARRWAAGDLHQVWDKNWREEGTPAIDVAAFGERFDLREIDVSANRLTFWFDDGGLFLGHAIEVRCSLDGEFIECGLAG